MKREFLIATAALLSMACGGSVDSDSGTGTGGTAGHGTGGAAGGSGGAGAVGGTGAVGGVSGSGGGVVGGAGGVAGNAGAGGGPIACGQTDDRFNVKIAPYSGDPPACPIGKGGESSSYLATGAIVKSSPTAMTIDQCPPNADCMQMLTEIAVDAKDLDLTFQIGTYVEVQYDLTPGWGGCTELFVIRNVPSWGGVLNPFSQEAKILFAAADGGYQVPSDATFQIKPMPLGCKQETGCGGITPDDYSLAFTSLEGAALYDVGMGQTTTFGWGTKNWQAHNLRSFQTNYCDDYWNWAYWIREKVPGGTK